MKEITHVSHTWISLIVLCLRSEFKRARVSPSLPWIVTGLFVISVVMGLATIRVGAEQFGSHEQLTMIAICAGVSLVPYIASFVGCASVTGEFSSGASRLLYGSLPRRWPGAVAKLIFIACYAATLALLAILAGCLGVSLAGGWSPRGAPALGDLLCLLLGSILACCVLGLMGGAIGFIVKSSQVGVLTLVVILVIAPILAGHLARHSEMGTLFAGALPLSVANSFVDPLREVSVLSIVSLGGWGVAAVASAIIVVRRAEL